MSIRLLCIHFTMIVTIGIPMIFICKYRLKKYRARCESLDHLRLGIDIGELTQWFTVPDDSGPFLYLGHGPVLNKIYLIPTY